MKQCPILQRTTQRPRSTKMESVRYFMTSSLPSLVRRRLLRQNVRVKPVQDMPSRCQSSGVRWRQVRCNLLHALRHAAELRVKMLTSEEPKRSMRWKNARIHIFRQVHLLAPHTHFVSGLPTMVVRDAGCLNTWLVTTSTARSRNAHGYYNLP